MKQLPDYSLIDQKATGAKLKSAIRASGYRVCEIQQFLSLSCPQPIYRWFRGDALPSLHHLYALSGLLDIPLDDLLVQGQTGTAGSDSRTSLSNSAKSARKTGGSKPDPEPLQIDFEKADGGGLAPGMYGVALLARLGMCS